MAGRPAGACWVTGTIASRVAPHVAIFFFLVGDESPAGPLGVAWGLRIAVTAPPFPPPLPVRFLGK